MAPPTERDLQRHRLRNWSAITVALVAGILLGTVAVKAIVEHRSPVNVVVEQFVPPPQQYFHKDKLAILMLGIDYDYNSKDEEYSANARTDTIKAVAVDLPTPSNPSGSLATLSVLRDTDTILPSGREDKINAAYGGFNGDSVKAAHNSELAVSKFLGIPKFDRYITLRIDATKDLIDAIGGIDVVPDETMNYDDSWGHLHIHFIGNKKYHMNGEQAVSYARFRHDACSDPCRSRRQDQVIRLTIAKLKNDKFNDLLHINSLIGVVRKNVYTDLSAQEMLSLAWAFSNFNLSKLNTQQVPFTGDKELACCGDVLVADDDAKARLVKKLFLTGEPQTPADPASIAAVNPRSVHVIVQNGSGVGGQGARVAAMLRKAGFLVDRVGNAPNFAYDTTEIHGHSLATPLAAERVRTALAATTATVQTDPADVARTAPGDVTVIVGRDLAASAATAPASEASAVK
jgi:LCP family protein required for cell wall assembly